MEIKETKIPGVFILYPRRFSDDRGFFSESWSKRTLEQVGIKCDFVQDNHSFSKKVGTLRGLHFQYPPFAQAKLVRCIEGEVLDIALDLRKQSKTYGHYEKVVLSA